MKEGAVTGEIAPGPQAIRLEGLWIYPIKSCAGVTVSGAELDAQGGLKGDREWVVVNANGEMQWQGGIPRLALVQPVPEADLLRLQAPGASSLKVDPTARGEHCDVKIWNEITRAFDRFEGWEAGRAAGEWFSDFLGQPLRLVRLGATALRRPTANPLHVVTSASLRQLNMRMQAGGLAPVQLERFRPNLLVDSPTGVLAPFAEERFASLSWPQSSGAPLLRLVDSCVRCVMVNINPRDASVTKEPLATVAQMSRERRPDAPPSFGVYGRGQNGGVLTRGDLGWAEMRS